MLKLSFDLDDGGEFKIIQNDRGEWQIKYRGYATILQGYGGENEISIITTYMQNGSSHIMFVAAAVDGYVEPSKVYKYEGFPIREFKECFGEGMKQHHENAFHRWYKKRFGKYADKEPLPIEERLAQLKRRNKKWNGT